MCIVIYKEIVTRKDRIAFKIVRRIGSRVYESKIPSEDRRAQLGFIRSVADCLVYRTGYITCSDFMVTAGIYCYPDHRGGRCLIRVLIPKGTRVRLSAQGWHGVFTAERVRVLGMVK